MNANDDDDDDDEIALQFTQCPTVSSLDCAIQYTCRNALLSPLQTVQYSIHVANISRRLIPARFYSASGYDVDPPLPIIVSFLKWCGMPTLLHQKYRKR